MTAAPAQLDLDVPDNDHFVPAVDHPDPEAEIADHLGSVVPDCEQHPVPYPPPKIDKPRPHTCKTCERSFARLEHLKRHERSHTKEKPFECPVCERCFARRDLLLRHQQKLHQSTPSSSRPRHRRESSSGAIIGLGRVRKNSALSQNSTLAASAAASMRPRANTISHIDAAAIHFAAANAAVNGPPNTSGSAFESVSRPLPHGHNRHASLNGLPIHNLNFNQGYGGMAAAMGHRSMEHVLPILETHRIGPRDFNPGLRTAPSIQFNHDFDLDGFFLGPAPTINPTALCYSDSPPPLVLDPTSPYPQTMHEFANRAVDDAFDWLNGFESQMTFVNDDISLESNTPNDNTVIDGSSPSERSSTSQSGISDIMLDGSKHSLPPGSTSMWHPAIGPPQMLNTYVIDPNSSVFPDLVNGISISPDPMSQKIPDSYFSAAPPSINPLSPSVNSTLNVHNLNPSLSFDTEPETPDSLIGGPFTPASTLAIQSNSNTLVSDIPCP